MLSVALCLFVVAFSLDCNRKFLLVLFLNFTVGKLLSALSLAMVLLARFVSQNVWNFRSLLIDLPSDQLHNKCISWRVHPHRL